MRKYGWVADLPDHRDHLYALVAPAKALPSSVDLRSFCPPVYDQGQLGSCTANAIAGACELVWIREGHPNPYTPSRLAIYFGERQLEGTIDSDSGAQIRDGIKVINQQGFASEDLWPYDPSQLATPPSSDYYTAAGLEKVISYASVPQQLTFMKQVLNANDPIVVGFTVYESFESYQVSSTGLVPMPGHREQVLGGHAVLVVGYDDNKQCFIVRNSWGDGWGDAGYCYMPYAYLCSWQLARDFWTVKTVP